MLSSNESPEEVEEAGNVGGAAITLTAPASFAFLCTVTVSWIVRTIGSGSPEPACAVLGAVRPTDRGAEPASRAATSPAAIAIAERFFTWHLRMIWCCDRTEEPVSPAAARG